MAKKGKKDQPVEDNQPVKEAPKAPKVPKERSILLTLLTILLILVGIGEVSLWGLWGFGVYQNNRAERLYQQEQKAAEEERAAQGIIMGSASGPNLKVENGVETWRREDRLPSGNGSPAQGTELAQENAEKRLSSLSVPEIRYTLAEQDVPDTQPQNVPSQAPDPTPVQT